MRSAVLVALLVTSAAMLAGCSKKDDDDHSYSCPNGTTIDLEKYPDHHNATFNAASHCPGYTTSKSNSTSLPPNQLPILKLKVTDGKNETKIALLNGNLTFDAAGSSDPDGSVTGIAVTIQDSNTTRTAALFDPAKKTFKTATFRFDRPGVVNVTVAMVDDRAGFTVNQTHVYVDQVFLPPAQSLQAPNPDPIGATTPACGGFNPLIDAQYYKPFDFPVVAGATWVEATATSEALLTICSPDDAALSPEKVNPVQTTPATPLPPPAGIDSYYVSAYLDTGPNAQVSVQPTITIHYEPDTRSA